MHEKGFKNLVTAILKCAVEDYMDEYREYIEEPSDKKANYLRLRRKYFEENCNGLTYIGEALVERAEFIVRQEYSAEMVSEADRIYNMVLAKAAA